MQSEKFSRLAAVLGSDGWNQEVVPAIMEKLKADFDTLAGPTRNPNISDDYMRGRVWAWKWFLTTFNERLQEYAKTQEPSDLTEDTLPPVAPPTDG